MNWRGVKRYFDIRQMSSQKATSVVFVATLLVLVIGYGIWQFGKILSPSQQFSSDPIITLRVSDYSLDGASNPVPLPNNLTDGTIPHYDGSHVVELNYTGQQLNMARIQGEVDYR